MLAARDQENLVHGHQTAAASKHVNQGVKNLPPKTPGNKYPKTPLKLPLNDENAPIAFLGRTGGKVNGKGLENGAAGAKGGLMDKNAFITPMGPRNRAPLGLKTTNAKAKGFQTPARPAADDALNKGNDKTQPRSASARRPKPRVSHAETTKVDPKEDEHALQEQEIEYMPPKPVDLPDFPDEMPHDMEYPMLKDGNLTRGLGATYYNPVDDNGVSEFEKRLKEQHDKADKGFDERMERIIDEMPLLGWNVPEFPGQETAVAARKRREAEMQKAATMRHGRGTSGASKPVATVNGPSSVQSRKASALLSKEPSVTSTVKAKPNVKTAKARAPSSILSHPKKSTQSHDPTEMRHTAATAASRTTLGYSKGRIASNSLQKMSDGAASGVSLPKVAPIQPRQNVPSVFSPAEWENIKQLDVQGLQCDDEELEPGLRGLLPAELMRDQAAEEDFVLQW